MPTPKEEALDVLCGLKSDFDAAVKDAQEDGRRWKWLRHYPDPKARENEFAGYKVSAAAAADFIVKDDTGAAKQLLQGLKTAFDAVAADCRAQPQDFLESCFQIYAQEAQRFEAYAAKADRAAKLI